MHVKTYFHCLLIFLIMTTLAAGGVLAQDAALQSTTAAELPAQLVPVPIKIAPGDLLDVSVFDTPELTQQVRVGADGGVQLALIGSATVGGLTAQQAAETIARALRDGHFLLRPQVNVVIKEYASQGVSVLGEVQRPGVYQVLGPRTLLDVLSMAGGLTNTADTRITVERRGGNRAKFTVKLKNDDVHTSIANDVQIYPGDLVMVARAGVVYILGDVNRPGGFVMQDNGHITLLQALAQAGGPSPTASMNKAVLLHKTGDEYVSDKVPVGKIARGQLPDLELQANDVVFIPNSRLKRALQTAQSVGAQIGSATIYATAH